MPRNVSALLVLLIVVALGAGAYFLVAETTADSGPDDFGAGYVDVELPDTDTESGSEPGGSANPKRNPDEERATVDEAPPPPPKPTAPIPVEIAWYGTAVSGSGASESRADRAPFPALAKSPVFERKIIVHCAPDVVPPVLMEARFGSPWGEFRFPAESDGKTFVLRDRYGNTGPRSLRFYFDEKRARFVERWLEPGDGDVSFYFGPPGDIVGTLLGPDGRPAPGVALCDGQTVTSDPAGKFTLTGIHGGNAVVRVAAVGLAATRYILQSPGGPYSVRMPTCATLAFNLARTDVRPRPEPFWGCAIPDAGGLDQLTCAAEDFYHRETLGGSAPLAFDYMPVGWNGIVVVWHPRFATQILPFKNLATTTRTIQPEPRTILTGSIVDAAAKKPIENAVVVTSAESTTLYDALASMNYLRTPREEWRQPVPFLGRPLVDKELTAGGGFRLHVDPMIRRIDVAVFASGYVPVMLKDVAVAEGAQPLTFRLERDRPEGRATIVLHFADSVEIDWPRLAITARYRGHATTDEAARTITFQHLAPGAYGFRFPSLPQLGAIEVNAKGGSTERVELGAKR